VTFVFSFISKQRIRGFSAGVGALHCVHKKWAPLNILQQQAKICADFKILHTWNDIYFEHYTVVSQKSYLVFAVISNFK